MFLATATLFEPIGRHLTRDPLRVAPDASCAEVIERMTRADATRAYVVDSEDRLLGIVTTGDIARRVTFRLSREDEVERAMTAAVQAVREDEPLFRALVRMRRSGWRSMPVVDADGRLLGALAADAALAQPLALLERLVDEDSVAGMARVKAAQAELATALLEGAHSMPDIQALFSQVNLDIHRRAVALALEAMAADGWGQAPARFSVIVMGSIGRGESLLAPDQDNGFILEDHAEGERVVVERFFAELAGRMTAALAQAGFPLCRGNVMASNPIWRMPLAGWKRQIESWIAQRSAEAILQADICFDFSAATEPALAQALRAHTLAALARGQPFLRDMCLALMDHKVALGLFGGLAAEPAGDRQRTNLKLRGLMPLVAAVRLLALREGLADTSTLARIAALASRGVLSGDEREALADAYRDLSYLVLRQQLADLAARRPAGNLVSTAGWSRERRARLADSLRAVEELQRRVREDFTGQIL